MVRKVRPYSGLVRYEARSDTPDWSQAVKDVLAAEKPNAIVVMLGSMIGCRCAIARRRPKAQPLREDGTRRGKADGTRRTGPRCGPAGGRAAGDCGERDAAPAAAATSFTPTNGPSFTTSASTT